MIVENENENEDDDYCGIVITTLTGIAMVLFLIALLYYKGL
jgi:hypothetical protein